MILFSTTLLNSLKTILKDVYHVLAYIFYTSAFIYQILSDSDTYKFIVLMSDGLSTDRKDAIVEAKLFTMSPYHIIICIGVGARVDHLELIQIASRDDSGIYGPLVFPSSTQDSINMIAKLTMRKDCASKVVIQVNIRYLLAMNNKQYLEIC